MMPRHFVLGRHGFSNGNLAWRLAREGDTTLLEELMDRPAEDAKLVDFGRKQIVAMGRWLRKEQFVFDRLYASPLKRTQQSARLLRLKGEWIYSEYLAEQRLGIMRFMKPEEREEYLNSIEGRPHVRDPWNFAPVGGESFAEIDAGRTGPFLEMVESECSGEESIFVMGHSGTNKMLDCRIRQWTPKEFIAHYVHGDNKIFNGMVLHYTRINPETGEESSTLDWVRTCCPWFDFTSSPWQKIERGPQGFTLMSFIREFLTTPAA